MFATTPQTPNEHPEKPLAFAGQSVVFTGKLASLPRKEAQAVVRQLGGTTPPRITKRVTLLVIGDEGYLKAIVKSNKLKRAEEINAAGGKIRIISETEFLEMAGLESKAVLEQKFYSLDRVQSVFPSIRPDLVKYFARWGLFKPAVKTNANQYYQFKDLLVFRQINELLSRGLPLRKIAARLVAAQSPSPQIPISFEEFKPRGQILSLYHPPQPMARSAEEWYALGYEYDTNPETYEKAIEAYENALTQNPNYVEAMINLANIYYAKRELNRARQLLERAVQLDPSNHTIYYNLGNLYDEFAELEKAVQSYQKALELYSEYEPALFNLALIYERLGLVGKAEMLWRKYLEVDPLGEWAEIAREHLRGERQGATG
ncbi:MAG: tetratricopeptide repeat protein [candidate division KSB1 bacterium]|nr:tetratricopeptide repeat protein [candidate division KSB1 bacterium]MDZ7304505.1 tetratricopeptide repeat protein [candidate division KSB1 bacterium]MDZ7313885.1 tetratricopeptide repeat protein [candidate division KSB1 bacterium]